jgi:hypothetical protein
VTSIPTTANVTVNAPTLSTGSYQLLVQGTSGSTTHTLLIPFNVGDYQISGTQALSVGLGAQGTSNLSIAASTYYSGKINATCDASSLPGAVCTLVPGNPITVNLGSTVSLAATISVPSSAALGTYNINVNTQDTTGAPSHSFTIAVSVVQNFQVTSSTASQTVIPGQITGAYNLTVQPIGASFSGAVTLSCSSGLPAGAQCLFTPSGPVTPGKSRVPVVMTISTSIPTTCGTYAVTITGTSGSLSHSVPVSLIVSNDFQLGTVFGFPANVVAQSSQTAMVSVTPNYNGVINATCNIGTMLGAQCTISPANPVAMSANVPVTLTVLLTIANSTPPAAYNINITVADASGQPNHVLALPLTVQDFSVAATTASQTISPGQTTGSYKLTLTPNPTGAAFSGAVTLSCSGGLPPGAQCLFSPSTPVTPPASVVMTISTAPSTALNTYPVTVTATSGSLSHSVVESLIVTSNVGSNDFQLAVTQAFPANADAGMPQTAKVSVTPNYSGSINASCDASSMSGAQCVVTPANPVAISANMALTLSVALTVPNTAAPAAYTINLTVADASGGQSHTLQLPLIVIPDFSVSSATPIQTITAGETTGPYQLTVAPNPQGYSFGGAVTLSCPSGLPAGAQCLFNPSAPQTPGDSAVSVVMTISTAKAASQGRRQPREPSIFYALALLLPGIVISWSAAHRAPGRVKPRAFCSITMLLLLMWSLLSCGGVSTGGNGSGSSGNTPTTYVITVTGTSGSLTHSAAVSLVMQ